MEILGELIFGAFEAVGEVAGDLIGEGVAIAVEEAAGSLTELVIEESVMAAATYALERFSNLTERDLEDLDEDDLDYLEEVLQLLEDLDENDELYHETVQILIEEEEDEKMRGILQNALIPQR